jgi:hypothetical protein
LAIRCAWPAKSARKAGATARSGRSTLIATRHLERWCRA